MDKHFIRVNKLECYLDRTVLHYDHNGNKLTHESADKFLTEFKNVNTVKFLYSTLDKKKVVIKKEDKLFVNIFEIDRWFKFATNMCCCDKVELGFSYSYDKANNIFKLDVSFYGGHNTKYLN